jgi:hypothetical protein
VRAAAEEILDPRAEVGGHLLAGALGRDQLPDVAAEVDPFRAGIAPGDVAFHEQARTGLELSIQEPLDLGERLLALRSAITQ